MAVKFREDKCRNCNSCLNVHCPAGNVKKALKNKECLGCGACSWICPFGAIFIENGENVLDVGCASVEINEKFAVTVNGRQIEAKGTVKDALNLAGIEITNFLDECSKTPKNYEMELDEECVFMPCNSGGCWACVMEINGKMGISCITPLSSDMEINTLQNIERPLRVVSGFGAHKVGGVGTPYPLKKNDRPVEVAGFTHGCNLRCPQCQNNLVAFGTNGNLLDPEETAQILLGLKAVHDVDTITLSGGESTLNRPWIISTIHNIKKLDNDVNIHVDTNGTILNSNYIDELVNVGMNRIGIDLKGIEVSTFQKITGLHDEEVAEKFMKNSWNAIGYIIENYDMEYPSENNLKDHSNINSNIKNKFSTATNENNNLNFLESNSKPGIFLGIGIPYNKSLISKKEIEKMGKTINNLDPKIQVCVLDYRPEFRRRDIEKPKFDEMMEIKTILNDQGLETVIVQTEKGHFGP